ncbi:DNA replication/repair protein RecF [Rapidithrix thailandica]|uniref:DNA replication and repair protein RecF n=1 Tax=Rapidithrix thailandica TaxID=413964 RepID=A0AAW9S8U0_9BACT
MYLKDLRIISFKNYEESELHFSAQINCFTGANGSGKTNLLDAIHYLCLTKSAFNAIDAQNIRHQAPLFALHGTFFKNEKEYQVSCGLKAGKKKSIRLNKKEYERVSEHIGQFPCVLIAPNDTDLIREGSETRRKYFDSIISQINKPYLEQLICYNQALKQRNILLKQFAEQRYFEQDLLEPYDHMLIDLSQKIAEQRRAFITTFQPLFEKHYQYISAAKEQVALNYSSQVKVSGFEEHFRNNLQKDMHLQRTTSGIHKDDFDFSIEEYPLKKFGSQGQQKSYVIALKLAQFEVMHQATGRKPILLMDDIFDKLDDLRIAKLLQMITEHIFGQVFITDAREERSRQLMKQVHAETIFFDIEQLSA